MNIGAIRMLMLAGAGCALSACNYIVLDPNPVVPTTQPVPYSVGLELTDVGAFLVQPGATMTVDPRLQNHVTATIPSLERAKPQWEEAILEYLAVRRTFQRVVKEGVADLLLTPPGAHLRRSGRLLQVQSRLCRHDRRGAAGSAHGRALIESVGKGKAFGEVSRGGKDDDREPINRAVRAALNDLFDKL